MVLDAVINRYRMRCTTEDAFVSVWSLSEPTSCPNGHDHVIDPGATVIVDTVADRSVRVNNLPITPFDRVLVSEETPIIDIKPGLGVSSIRDDVATTGGGSVSSAVGAPEFALVAPPGGSARLRSAERGRYLAGTAAEVGIGGHLLTPVGADQRVRFGLYDDSNGFYFEISDGDLCVCVRKSGVETVRVARADFNVDPVDGTGPSGTVLNPGKGYIWTIRFSWSYGVVQFGLVAENAYLEQRNIPMHRYFTQFGASVSNPNLPITCEVTNGAQPESPAVCAAVTGRKYGVLGRYSPEYRRVSVHAFFEDAAAPNAKFAFAIRRRSGREAAPVTIEHVDARASSAAAIVVVRTGPVDGAAWGAVPDFDPGETVVEYTSAGSPAANSIVIWKGFAHVGHGDDKRVHFTMKDNEPVSVEIVGLAGAGRVALALVWQEEW